MTKQQDRIQTIVIVTLLIIGVVYFSGLKSLAIPLGAMIPIDDTYSYQDRPTDIRGDSTRIRSGWNNEHEYRAYMKFKIRSDIIDFIRDGGSLDSAELNIYVDYTDRVLLLFREVQNNWQEESLNWNNQPVLGDVISSSNMQPIDEDKYKTITGFESYIERKVLAGGDEISIAISPDHLENDDATNFWGKERSVEKPYLLIKYSCTPEVEKKCYNNDVYWFDSCGDRGSKYEECGTRGCANGVCLEACIPNHHTKCFNNNIYWFDSCDNRESVKEYCDFECEVVEGSPTCFEKSETNYLPLIIAGLGFIILIGGLIWILRRLKK